MNKIRTAEEILKDWITSPEGGWEPSDHEAVIEAMQEYAKQFINLAAEEAEIKIIDICEHKIKHGTINESDIVVDKESILKLKERVV